MLEFLRFLKRRFKCRFGRLRDERGQFRRLRRRKAHHASDIPDRALGCHLGEGDDMGHAVLSVGVHHVLQHFGAAGVIEVDVDIRHGDTFGVEEPLEEEPVLDRIDVCDAERIRDGRPCRRATAWPYPNAQFLAGGMDIILDDEEIAGKLHFVDGRKFFVNACAHVFRQRLAPASRRSLECKMVEIFVL